MINRKGKSLVFPEKFLWGTSTAAHQVEGNNNENDWWDWEQAGKIKTKSGRAIDHYNKFTEDFTIAKALNNNAHRLSLEWSRIEPKEGQFNQKEVLHYRQVLQELKKQGLTSFVTLHHFTNPRWFAAKGGFEDSKNIKYFEKYVEFCAKEFGDLVDFWITINEPVTYILQSYINGVWPPGKTNILTAGIVMVNLGRAHNNAYQILHKNNPQVKAGVAYNMIEFKAKSDNFLDVLITQFFTFIENDFFFILTDKKHDFWGINYYTKYKVSFKRLFGKKVLVTSYGMLQDKERYLGWSMDPSDLGKFLKKVSKRMDIPIYITEHGIADSSDKKRRKLLVAALSSVQHAIKKGLDVRGYFHWSLIDNFEWDLGYTPKFGLYKVNRKTLIRSPRKSAEIYSKIAKDNGIVKVRKTKKHEQ